MTDPYQN